MRSCVCWCVCACIRCVYVVWHFGCSDVFEGSSSLALAAMYASEQFLINIVGIANSLKLFHSPRVLQNNHAIGTHSGFCGFARWALSVWWYGTVGMA